MHNPDSINIDPEDLSNPFPLVAKIGTEVGHGVPANYFESLAGQIMDEIESQEILNAAPSLGSLKKEDPYTVPEGYFEALAGQIQSEINLSKTALKSPVLPDSFFEEQALQIESAIALEKLQLSKEEPYKVPAGYFEMLSGRIQDRTEGTREKRPVMGRIKQLVFDNYWIPASLAAVCVLLLGIRMFLAGPEIVSPAHDVALNEGDKKEVIDNLELYGFDDAIVLDHVSSKSKMIENTDASPDKKATIDYLIENNVDVNSISTDNPDNI
jgi:hypothetical protein